jgi:hypothetical protein
MSSATFSLFLEIIIMIVMTSLNPSYLRHYFFFYSINSSFISQTNVKIRTCTCGQNNLTAVESMNTFFLSSCLCTNVGSYWTLSFLFSGNNWKLAEISQQLFFFLTGLRNEMFYYDIHFLPFFLPVKAFIKPLVLDLAWLL